MAKIKNVKEIEKEKQVEYPIYEMEGKGKLILPQHIISQITFLHSHVGRSEWSGMLLYDVEAGNPSRPEGFVLRAEHIFLMDIGTAGSTEYETDGDIVDMYDEVEGAMEMKTGHIHTHHDMTAYFSGVDMDELMHNVDKYNYYLSLVVNHSGNYSAKVVFLSDMHTTSKMNYKDDSGNMKHFKQSVIKQHMVVINMRILFGGLSDFFTGRLQGIKDKIKEAEKKEKELSKSKYSLPEYNGNSMAGYGRPISNSISPDKMTNWEVEKLTVNVLMFNPDMTSIGNVYAILNQIVDHNQEAELDLYYEYVKSNLGIVLEAYFDEPLDAADFEVVIGEISNCIGRYKAVTKLAELVKNLDEVFGYALMDQSDENVDEQDDMSNALEREAAEMEDQV